MSKLRGDQEVTRLLKGGLVATNLTSTATTAAGTLTLSVFSASTQVLTGTATGYSVNLGDATQYPTTGVFFYIHNRSTQSVLVKDGSGATISTIPKNFTLLAVLRTNGTVAGTWDLSGFIDGTKFIDNSASPGYTFGKDGNATLGTWLRNENVPSNKAGRRVAIFDPIIRQISASCELVGTFNLGIYTHDGNEVNLTLVDTLNIVAARGATKDVEITIAQNKQIAVRVDSGSTQNVLCTVIVNGRFA